MKKFEKYRYIVLGMLLSVLLFSFTSPALAAMSKKNIEVYTGINIYIDDVKLDPRDANGNPIEPFIYNGTTYLPVRAIGEAFGKVVQWDGATSSVFVGRHDSEEPAVLLQDLDYFTGSYYATRTTDKDNLGNTMYNCMRLTDKTNTYKINGQYSRMSGTLFQLYDYRSTTGESKLEIYGDGKLLYTAKVSSGIEPIDFTVSLEGVLELKIVTTSPFYNGSGAGLYCGLYS